MRLGSVVVHASDSFFSSELGAKVRRSIDTKTLGLTAEWDRFEPKSLLKKEPFLVAQYVKADQ
jgi:hypothetical protein